MCMKIFDAENNYFLQNYMVLDLAIFWKQCVMETGW